MQAQLDVLQPIPQRWITEAQSTLSTAGRLIEDAIIQAAASELTELVAEMNDIKNVVSTARLQAATSGTRIRSSWAGNRLTCNGKDSLENYQRVLRSITMSGPSGDYIVAFIAKSDSGTSNRAQCVVKARDELPRVYPGPSWPPRLYDAPWIMGD